MNYFMRNVAGFIINPLFLCWVLLGICTYFLWRRKYSLFVKLTMSLVFVLLFFVSTGWMPKLITNTLESQYPVIMTVDPAIKWIVVLSGGQSSVSHVPPNDVLSAASMKRLIEGVRLYRLLPTAKLVLSGGGTFGDQPEALLLNELTRWFAVPDSRIVLEEKSINTADQAKELVNIVHKDPFYLVTSAIHMPRSMALCHQYGLHPIAAPTDYTFLGYSDNVAKKVIPNTYNLAQLSIALHELLGRVWAYVSLKIA